MLIGRPVWVLFVKIAGLAALPVLDRRLGGLVALIRGAGVLICNTHHTAKFLIGVPSVSSAKGGPTAGRCYTHSKDAEAG